MAPTCNVVEVGSFNEKRLLYKVLSIITYHLVDRIICISGNFRNVTQKKGDQGQVRVIYNGFDAEAWIKLDTDQTLKGIADHSLKENNLTFCMITRNTL